MASKSASACSRGIVSITALLVLGASPGCEYLSPELNAQLAKIWRLVGRSIFGEQAVAPPVSPSAKPSPKVSAASTASSDGGGLTSDLAKKSKVNGEILREMIFVVYNREPRDRAGFGSLVDSMNQGASFEGIYNGLSHSSAFRQLESENPGATPGALKVFAQELALLEAELPAQTEFDDKSARPLAMPVQPSSDGTGGGETVEFGQKEAKKDGGGVENWSTPTASRVDVRALSEKYAGLFVGASVFTLKRVLGDEALKVIAAKSATRDGLASWFAKWAARTSSYGVDFGIPQRNSADEQFHARWAITAADESLKWEVLNRLHRLLNHANFGVSAPRPSEPPKEPAR